MIDGGSLSFLRDVGGTAGLFRYGGGDFSRGDTGHRGDSLEVSDMIDGFCGAGVDGAGSGREGGCSAGVVAEESCCRGVGDGVGMLDLILDGLESWKLFFRDADADADADTDPDVDVRLILPGRIAGLVGEDSRDTNGDAVNDVLADVHLEGCVSTFALDVAEVSLSTEVRLDRLASMAVVGFAMTVSSWLDLGLRVGCYFRKGYTTGCA